MVRRRLLHGILRLCMWVLLSGTTAVVVRGTAEDTAASSASSKRMDASSTAESIEQAAQSAGATATDGDGVSSGEESSTTTPKAEETSTSDSSSTKKQTETTDVKAEEFDVENEDWGFYYDPQNVFCGKFDCYQILGFDYESFGKIKPSTKEITKRYRQLSREWHPDKSKHKYAKSRFVKIARAYEVLTSREKRAEYDYMRYNQEAYFSKYGANVLWSYAPKSDTALVILFLLVIANIISWYAQKHRWQMVADRLIKAAVEDWLPRDGGTPESKQLREDALQLWSERQQQQQQENEDAATAVASNAVTEPNTNGTTTTTNGTTAAAGAVAKTAASGTSSSNKKKSGKKATDKLSGREKKRMEQEALLPIVTELVNQMHDFGGGFHKPTYKDLLIVTLAKFPYTFTTGVAWQMKYWIRRLKKVELNEEECEVLTERAVGPVVWSVASEEDREDMLKRELWIKENFLEWQEEQEIKTLSSSEQKYYMKMKKKGKLDKLE